MITQRGSCERVHSCTEAVRVLVWCLIFITGCHQPKLPSLPWLHAAAAAAALPPFVPAPSALCFWIIKAPAWQLGQPRDKVWSQGLAGWCHSEHAVVSPATAREGLGQEGWAASLGSTLSQTAGKLHSSRYLCKDEVLISSAWDPQSVSPLENVLLCWEVLLLPHLLMCESELIVLADFSGAHATLCLLLLLFLMRNSLSCSISSTFWLSVLVWFFLPSHLPLFFLLLVISKWFSSYWSHSRITMPSAAGTE